MDTTRPPARTGSRSESAATGGWRAPFGGRNVCWGRVIDQTGRARRLPTPAAAPWPITARLLAGSFVRHAKRPRGIGGPAVRHDGRLAAPRRCRHGAFEALADLMAFVARCSRKAAREGETLAQWPPRRELGRRRSSQHPLRQQARGTTNEVAYLDDNVTASPVARRGRILAGRRVVNPPLSTDDPAGVLRGSGSPVNVQGSPADKDPDTRSRCGSQPAVSVSMRSSAISGTARGSSWHAGFGPPLSRCRRKVG